MGIETKSVGYFDIMTIEIKNIALFDKDGRQIYLYSFIDYEDSLMLASYTLVSKEELDKEIEIAAKLEKQRENEEFFLLCGKSQEEMEEGDWDKLYPDFDDPKTLEVGKKIIAKYPIEETEWEFRIVQRFNMFRLEYQVGTSMKPEWYYSGKPPTDQKPQPPPT